MTRYIDADVTLKHIDEYYDLLKRMGKPSRGMTAVIQNIKTIVNSLPTVDAEPVRHGKWITCTSSEHWKCSECGCRAGYWFNEENSGIESWEMDFSEWLSDYCPQCGCRMDKE